MKKHIKSLVAMSSLLTGALSAYEVHSEQRQTDYNLNVKLASQYIFRGIAQSDGEPVIQGDFSLFTPVNIYAGLWASNVKKPWGGVYNKVGGDEDFEYDLYIGYLGSIPSKTGGPDFKYDIGLIRYGFEDDPDDLTWSEAYIGVSQSGFSAKYSTRIAGAKMGQYVEARFNGSVKNLFKYSIHAGHYFLDQRLRGFDDYSDFSIGITKTYKEFDFNLTFFQNDEDGEGRYLDVADNRFVFAVSRNFNLNRTLNQ
ncbi:MAG: TorF family putative porin [Arenicellales bacterium]